MPMPDREMRVKYHSFIAMCCLAMLPLIAALSWLALNGADL